MTTPISRLISGTASISIPPEWLEFREVYLSTAVVREPSNKYLNLNYTPPRSRYGTITVLSSGLYVRDEFTVDYELQYYTLFSLQPSQNFLALICALESTLQSIVSLSIAIPDTFPITKSNPIEDWTYASPNVDRIVITCYADTALFVSLIPVEMERCNPADGIPQPPPPPPPPPPKVPTNTPLDGNNGNPLITPPQDGEPPELNIPFPIDTDEEPSLYPFGDRCVAYRVSYTYVSSTTGETLNGNNFTFWGEILGVDEIETSPAPGRRAQMFVRSYGVTTQGCRQEPNSVSFGSYNVEAGSLVVTIVPT